jgi:type IV pilus assembly protein PilV
MTRTLTPRPPATAGLGPVPARDRAGFTIVEVIVAILILTIGVLALAATAAVVTKQMARGNRQTVASTIAQARFDSLTSVDCTKLAAAGATNTGTVEYRKGQVSETWAVTDGNDVKTITDKVYVYGLRDTLVYTSLIPCRDN